MYDVNTENFVDAANWLFSVLSILLVINLTSLSYQRGLSGIAQNYVLHGRELELLGCEHCLYESLSNLHKQNLCITVPVFKTKAVGKNLLLEATKLIAMPFAKSNIGAFGLF